MTPLAAHADQAVRHAVDAYIDGRFLPTFEGQASFETRNSRYRLLDGVLLEAPDVSLVGAEIVGWLVEYPSRSEVTPTWKNGARAVLVDTRNDGVRGPHIVVTSATRSFRAARTGSAPRLPSPAAGSQWTQGGSTGDQAWGLHPAPVAPPAPVSPSWGHYPVPAPPAQVAAPPLRTLPPPPPVPVFASHAVVAEPLPLPAPPPMVTRSAAPPPPAPRPLPRAVPPPYAYAEPSMAQPYMLSRETDGGRSHARYSSPRAAAPAHQRGMPLR